MNHSPTHSFEQEFADELEMAWQQLAEAKRAVMPIYSEIQAWQQFQQIYNTHLAMTVEARRALEQKVEELLLERERLAMQAIRAAENEMGEDDSLTVDMLDDSFEDVGSMRDTETNASADGFKLPSKRKEDADKDIEQLKKAGVKSPKDRIADHFVRLYKRESERESIIRSDREQPYSKRMQIVNEIRGDDSSNEIDLLVCLPFDAEIDAPRWHRGLGSHETKCPESDPERLYRFRLWTRLLQHGREKLEADILAIRRSAIYDDFEIWKKSGEDEPTAAIERARERHEGVISQLEKQIESLLSELGD